MAQGVDELTDREREVLRLLLAGHTAKTIAAELDLSVHTVNDYLREARKKLGVSSSREAARILGEQEETAPQNHAPEEIGMGEASDRPDTPDLSKTPGGKSLSPWIIGGAIMFATAIAAILIFASAGTPEQGEDEVETMMEQSTEAQAEALAFVRLVDAGAYTQSWESAGPMFKSAVTAEGWEAQVKPVREPLGSLVSRNLKGVEAPAALPGAPEGEYRLIMFATDYTEVQGTTETVVMRKDAGQWGVVGYFIR